MKAATAFLEQRAQDPDQGTGTRQILSAKNVCNPKFFDVERAWMCFRQNAERNRKLVLLSRAEWKTLVLEVPCHYCGVAPSKSNPNTVDRIDSKDKTYSRSTCVGACFFCTSAKTLHATNQFFGHIRSILLNFGFESVSPPPVLSLAVVEELMDPFPASSNVETEDDIFTRYKQFLSRSNRRGLTFDLSWADYKRLTQENCFYCNRSSSKVKISIDRFENHLPYLSRNCRPCCITCNKMKGASRWEDVLKKFQDILEHHHFVLKRVKTCQENM